MNMNVGMLFDVLIKFGVQLVDERPGYHIRLNLKTISLIDEAPKTLCPDTFYVCEEQLLAQMTGQLTGISLLVQADTNAAFVRDQQCAIVFVPHSKNMAAVLSTLFSEWRNLDEWDAKLMRHVRSENALNAILATAVERIGNPLLLVDATNALHGIVIAHAEPSDRWRSDELYSHILLNGQLPQNRVLYDGFVRAANELFSLPKEVCIIREDSTSRIYATVALFAQNHHRGVLLAASVDSPFSRGTESLLLHVKKALEQAFDASALRNAEDAVASSCISDLLNHADVPEQVLRERLKAIGRGLDDGFWCAVFADDNRPIPMTKRDLVVRAARRATHHWAIAVQHEGMVVLVGCKEDHPRTSTPVTNALRATCQGLALRVGVSSTFFGLGKLSVYANSCIEALELSKKANGCGPEICYFEDYAAQQLEHDVFSNSIEEPLIDPSVRALHAKDVQRGSDLCKTLFAYLSCGQSKSVAAKELHVHRNTLIYRLELIERLTGLNLAHEIADQQMLLRLLLSCGIVLHHD